MTEELFQKILSSNNSNVKKDFKNIDLKEINLSKEEKQILLKFLFFSPKSLLINIWKMNLVSPKINQINLFDSISLTDLYKILFKDNEDFLFSLNIYLKNLKKEQNLQELKDNVNYLG